MTAIWIPPSIYNNFFQRLLVFLLLIFINTLIIGVITCAFICLLTICSFGMSVGVDQVSWQIFSNIREVIKRNNSDYFKDIWMGRTKKMVLVYYKKEICNSCTQIWISHCTYTKVRATFIYFTIDQNHLSSALTLKFV